MQDLLDQFLIEARDLVQQATDDLLELERNPADRARLDGAFRAVHTLKGSVGLFDLVPMGTALHAGEDLLDAVREGRAPPDRATINILLELIGQTERWINALEGAGELPSDAAEDGEWLAGALRSRLPAASAEVPVPSPAQDSDWAEELLAEAARRDLAAPGEPLLALRYVPASDCFFTGDDPLALMRSVPELVAFQVMPRQPWASAAELDPFSCNLVIQALSRSPRADVQPIFRLVPDQVSFREIRPAESSERQAGDPPQSSDVAARAGAGHLRVDAKRIDQLVDLVGELVTAKNALSFVASQARQGSDFHQLVSGVMASQAAIDRLAADLHAAVMGIRMLPLRDALRGLPLAVRDLTIRLGKDVDLHLQGEGVEADKSVVDGLFEPLLHLVRNAVDHGIEPEPQRRAAGKPARGRIDLRARRNGDRIVIEIVDDGRGIDPASIRQAALDRGLYAAEVIGSMSDAEAVNLIFSPGFSTAATVSDVSGRGVGMDAVRAAVERLGGTVAVSSVPGRGTTIRLALPVTAVLTKIMVVQVGADSFGIPMDAVTETARLPRDRVMPLGNGQAFVFRDRTLPLLHLSRLLGSAPDTVSGQDLRVLLVAAGSDLVGVAVDAFAERLDVMLRPMAGMLAGMPGYAGTTLRGDGSVLMVLDMQELLA